MITGFLDMWKIDVHFSIRTENQRYIRYGRGGEEFYQCYIHPREWTNQINNSDYASEMKQMVSMLPKAARPIHYRNREDKKSAEKPCP
ncbi:MAG: hypothetical protein L7V86_12670 [Verrucomicrobiales bacterium]|nr:hypothetical protein [Verrucomicrobiales bacterium]